MNTTNPKLVQPDWRKSHKFDHRPYASPVCNDKEYVTLALHQPPYLDVLATDESDEYYDLKIVGQDGYFIYAHKLVLCSNSPFVGGLFDDQLPGEITTLILPDIPIDSIQQILELAYNGATNVDKDKLGEFKLLLQQMGFIRLRFLLPKGVSSVVDEEYNAPAKIREDVLQVPQEPCCSKTLTPLTGFPKPSLGRMSTASTLSNAKDSQQSSSSKVATTRSIGTTISSQSPSKSAHFPVKVNRREHEDFVIISSDSEVSEAEPPKTTPTKKTVLTRVPETKSAKPVEIAQGPEPETKTQNAAPVAMSEHDRERFPDPPEAVTVSNQEVEDTKLDDSDDIIEIFPSANDETPKKIPVASTEARNSPLGKGYANSSLEVKGPPGNGNCPCPRRQHLDKNKSKSTSLNDHKNLTRNADLNRSPGSSDASQPGWRSCVRTRPNSNSGQPAEQVDANSENATNVDAPGTLPTPEKQPRRRGRKRKGPTPDGPEVVSLGTADEGRPRKRQPKKLSDDFVWNTNMSLRKNRGGNGEEAT